MFHTEMLSNGGRRILVLVNALMQMPPCVTNITCITQVTFKLINKELNVTCVMQVMLDLLDSILSDAM